MRPANSDVHDLVNAAIQSGIGFVYAECYTFILVNGDRFYYTAAQQSFRTDSLIDGASVEFVANELLMSGLKAQMSIGVNVDEQDLSIFAHPTDLIYGIPFVQAVQLGILDGAIIRRDRYFRQDWFSPVVGAVPMFLGRVSSIDEIGRQKITMKVKSYLVLLDIDMPKELMQPSCLNTLYDPLTCKVDKDLFAVHDVVGASPSRMIIPWTGALTTFSQGFILMDNGPSVGETRTIKQATGTALVLSYPLSDVPNAGDMFTAYPGCPKLTTTCGPFFSNLANFRGFPFVPPPETAL